MKKLILLFAITLIVSCKKDRSCTCTKTDGVNTPSIYTINVYKETKKQAAAGQCASYSKNENGKDLVIVTCKLN